MVIIYTYCTTRNAIAVSLKFQLLVKFPFLFFIFYITENLIYLGYTLRVIWIYWAGFVQLRKAGKCVVVRPMIYIVGEGHLTSATIDN